MRRRMLAGLLIGFGLIVVLLVNAGRSVPAPKVDRAHVAMVQQKQNAWLGSHPLLLKISRMEIAGVPGDLLTSTCWHMIGAVKTHPHSHGTKQDGRVEMKQQRL